jgi:two-component system chemotaxis response regulator CheB
MEVRSRGGKVVTSINDSPPGRGCRPSVNALFQSASAVYGGDLIAVILTGMGEDGTIGAATLKKKGAVVLAQDESTSVVWGMPGSVEKAGYVDRLLPLADIPEAVAAIIRRNAVK